MSPEKLGSDPREIKFDGEGKAESIKRGFAITTLRNPKPDYGFRRGERILADCFDDNKKVPVVVITNEMKDLKKFSIPQLALDGFFSVDHTIEGMKSHPGYEKINRDSTMQAITFVKEESFNALLEETKEDIKGGYYKFDQLVKLPELRHLFFPTMCFWLTETKGRFHNWIKFLKDNDLITNEEKRGMEEYQYLRGEAAARTLKEDPEALQILSLNPKDRAFGPLILGRFD